MNMKKRIEKLITKIQIKWKNSLLRKNLKLRGEIKRLEILLAETRKMNHKLLDQKQIDNIRIRNLILESKDANNNF